MHAHNYLYAYLHVVWRALHYQQILQHVKAATDVKVCREAMAEELVINSIKFKDIYIYIYIIYITI